jgi:hypothetical protein
LSVHPVSELEGQPAAPGPSLVFLGSLGVTAALTFGGVFNLQADYVLPFAVALLFILAAGTALLGWRQRRSRGHSITYWDAAGALLFVGIVISAMVEPDQMLRIVNDGKSP